jgi:hypothetical protein
MRSLPPHSCYMSHPSHHSRLDHSNYTWRRYKSSPRNALLSTLPTLHPSLVQIFSSAPCSQRLQFMFLR